MILKSFRVCDYKSITDSSAVEVEPKVTCLVGKNESGKTAALEALFRLNPVSTGHRTTFEGLYDFPRNRWAIEKAEVPGKTPISATLELQDEELDAITAELGEGVLRDATFTISRHYDNRLFWSLGVNERARIEHLIEHHGAKAGIAEGANTFAVLRGKLEAMSQRSEATEAVLAAITGAEPWREVSKIVTRTLPRFLYFDEYNSLPGTVNIAELERTEEEDLTPGMRTALSLLRLAGVQLRGFHRGELRGSQSRAGGRCQRNHH